jgi:lipopolysaccharide export system protein LptA
VQLDGVSVSSSKDVSAASTGGIKVTVVGTSLATTTEDDGFFEIGGIVSGTATLKFTAPGIDATLTVAGLVDGQILTVHVQCTSNKAEVVAPPKEITFSGQVMDVSSDGTWLKVDSREVTTSKRTTFDKFGTPVKPSEISVGWKVQVSGTVGKRNVVAATSIIVVSNTGKVEPGEVDGTLNQKHLDANGNPDYIVVNGQKFITYGDTQTGGSTYWKLWPSWEIVGHAQFSVGMQVKVKYETSGGQLCAKYVFKI